MSEWSELVPISDIYADGIADLERVGGENIRMILFVWQRGASGLMERVCVAKIVRPIASIMDLRSRLTEVASLQPPDALMAGKH